MVKEALACTAALGLDVGKSSHWACLVTRAGEIALNECVSSSPSFTKNHRSFQSSSLIFFTNHHGALGAPREAPSRGGEVSCLRRLPYEAAASARMRELRMR